MVALNDDGSYNVEIEGDGTLCGEVTAEYLRPVPAAICKEAEQTTRATSEGKGGGRCGETEPEADAEQTEGAGEADGAAEEQAPESLARSRPPRARKAVETFVAGPSQRPKPRGAASSANDDDDDDELTQTAVDAEGDAEDRPKKSPAKKSPAKKTARAPAKKATGAPHYCLKQAKVAAQGVCPDKAAPSPPS